MGRLGRASEVGPGPLNAGDISTTDQYHGAKDDQTLSNSLDRACLRVPDQYPVRQHPGGDPSRSPGKTRSLVAVLETLHIVRWVELTCQLSQLFKLGHRKLVDKLPQ